MGTGMQRAELIEYVRLELEDFWDALPELEGGAYAFLDNAILIVRDELQTLDLEPQGTLSLLQMMSEDKLSSLQFVASLAITGNDANPQLLTREQASELLQDYDLASVASWLGNSPKVAAEFYLTERQSAFLDAAKNG